MILLRNTWVALVLALPCSAFASPSVQVGFSPEGSAQALVLKVINQAHKSIRLIGYAFQAPDIVRALIAAHDRGVDVRIVVDEKRNRVKASRKMMDEIVQHGVQLRTDGHYHIQHDKTLIADERVVETGSFNFAPSAETLNSENVVVFRGMPAVTRQYLAHWQSRWDLGKPYQPHRQQ